MPEILKKHIQKNIRAEKEAIGDYKSAAKAARKKGNKKEYKLFKHIGEEESHHLSELKKALKRLGKVSD